MEKAGAQYYPSFDEKHPSPTDVRIKLSTSFSEPKKPQNNRDEITSEMADFMCLCVTLSKPIHIHTPAGSEESLRDGSLTILFVLFSSLFFSLPRRPGVYRGDSTVPTQPSAIGRGRPTRVSFQELKRQRTPPAFLRCLKPSGMDSKN